MAELGEDAGVEPRFSVALDDASQGAPVIRLSGDLDIAGVDDARAVVDRALEQSPTRLTFDLTDLRFMDSSGIAVLVAAAQRVDSVALHNPSPVIQRLLSLAGLAEIFAVTP